MKVSHRTVQHVVERKFFTLDDITELIHTTRAVNYKEPISSKTIAELFAEEFYNLEAVPVKILIRDGAFETTHWVNVTKDGQYVIDATGDRFDFTSFLRYKSHLTPWIYKKSKTSGFYFSSNHLPSAPPEGVGKDYTDIDIMMLSRIPFTRPTRCIVI